MDHDQNHVQKQENVAALPADVQKTWRTSLGGAIIGNHWIRMKRNNNSPGHDNYRCG